MDRLKKIRGHQRRKKNIEKWRIDNLPLDTELVKERNYDYVKIRVSPWEHLRHIARDYTGPNTVSRILILNALLDIYDSWDMQLKKLGIPYYLKIWLFEPRITSSQIVCGINDRIEFYENVFPLNHDKVSFPSERYKTLNIRLNQFYWTSAIDEEIIENDFWPKELYKSEKDFFQNQRRYSRLEKKQVKKEELNQELIENGPKTIRYFVPKGRIWLGTKK